MSASIVTTRNGERWIHGTFGTEPPYRKIRCSTHKLYKVVDRNGTAIRFIDVNGYNYREVLAWVADDVVDWLNGGSQ